MKTPLFSEDWVSYFFDICDVIASRSKDPSTRVGAIAVSQDRRILATGYNGFNAGVPDDPIMYPERYERPEKYDRVLHGEQNIIAQAAKHGISLNNSIVFVNYEPCLECTKLMIQSGILMVCYKPYMPNVEQDKDREWTKHINPDSKRIQAKDIYREAGVPFINCAELKNIYHP